jgi:spore coat assembly protein
MQINDMVILKEDVRKIIYVIDMINKDKAYISGLNYRIRMVTRTDELLPATTEQVETENKITEDYLQKIYQSKTRVTKNYLLGKILHIDGDKKYLDKCIRLYKEVGVFAYGVTVKENEMASVTQKLILELAPDIVILTGHDVYNKKGLKELENYANTQHYINAVRKIREIKPKSEVAIIAGACQSNFEALIANGADFASSPKRINIHTFDPAVIAVKIATTSFMKVVDLNEALRFIEKGAEAFGGVETMGKMRLFV